MQPWVPEATERPLPLPKRIHLPPDASNLLIHVHDDWVTVSRAQQLPLPIAECLGSNIHHLAIDPAQQPELIGSIGSAVLHSLQTRSVSISSSTSRKVKPSLKKLHTLIGGYMREGRRSSRRVIPSLKKLCALIGGYMREASRASHIKTTQKSCPECWHQESRDRPCLAGGQSPLWDKVLVQKARHETIFRK